MRGVEGWRGGGVEGWRHGGMDGGGKRVPWDDYLLNQRRVSSTRRIRPPGGRHVGV